MEQRSTRVERFPAPCDPSKPESEAAWAEEQNSDHLEKKAGAMHTDGQCDALLAAL